MRFIGAQVSRCPTSWRQNNGALCFFSSVVVPSLARASYSIDNTSPSRELREPWLRACSQSTTGGNRHVLEAGHPKKTPRRSHSVDDFMGTA